MLKSGCQLKDQRELVITYGLMRRAGTSNRHVIRLAQTGDARAVSGIHQRALGGSFLAKLGAGFLDHMYGYLIEREIVFVVMVGGRPVGFVSASVNPAGIMKRFMLNRPLCLIRIGLAVLSVFAVVDIKPSASLFTSTSSSCSFFMPFSRCAND